MINQRFRSRIPKRVQRGARVIPAQNLNFPLEALGDLMRSVDGPRQLPTSPKSSLPQARQFKITEIKQDYLVCYPWDGVKQTETPVYVARPYRLRGSETTRVFAGGTVNYSAYNSTYTQRTATLSGSETQVIVPEYVVGDVIAALSNVRGGTGVERSLADGSTLPVTWLDMNVDARAWAST